METKRCSKCGEECPATREYFKEHKSSKGGLRAMCRSCQREHDKQYLKPPLNDANILKSCTGCKTEYPATTEYFYPLPTGKYGLTSRCRECALNQNRQRIVEINTDPNIVKTCSKCGTTYPATPDYFTPTQGGLYGLTSKCKVCRRDNTQKWREENPESVKEYAYNYYWEHRDYLLEKNREWHRNNKERRRQSHRDWYIKNADHARKKRKNWYAENTDRQKEYDRQRYEQHAEEMRRRSRTYRAAHIEIERERDRRWRLENPEKARLKDQRRRVRKRQLPFTLNDIQWLSAIKYWDNCCAYCGERIDKPVVEHYIPLFSLICPGTIATNIVPSCMTCNASKGKKDPHVWLKERFGDEQAFEVERQVATYFYSLQS